MTNSSRPSLIARIRQGGFADEIAKETGLSKSWIRRVAREAGLSLPIAKVGKPASIMPSWVDENLREGWTRMNRREGEFAAAAWARAMKRNAKETAR